MKKLALTAALADYDHVRDLALGRVQADGIELTCLTLPIEEIFFRFIVYREWEVSEISLAKYVALTAQGDESYWALPVFPSRVFRHSSIYVRSEGPIASIKDLVRRRVGIPEWAQTAAVYSRGFLQHQYGIDLASIEWVQAGVNQPGRIEKVDVDLPDGVKLTRVSDKSLNQMLLSGEIDAAMAARPPDAFVNSDPRIRRLFPNYRQLEQEYYRSTGIFPIMHAVAVRRDVLHHHPWVPRNLFKAFDEAKRRSIARALEGTASFFPIPWGNAYAEEAMQLLGKDYFPYGIEENRTTLAAFLRYAHEQGICKRLLDVEELFPPQLHSTYRV
jgi:4,5-dihydroxyphthalate decarboxylase